MADDPTDNLPAPLELDLTIPSPINLSSTATEDEAKQADLPAANLALQAVHLCWGEVTSISSVQRLIKMTIEATKHRRDVLNLPYGFKSQGEAKSGLVYPID